MSILDGGFPAWRASGLPTESGPAPTVAPATYIPSPQPSLIATLADVRGVIGAPRDGDTPAIVDARPRGRFEGKDPEPRAGLSSGHMPHSVNVPFNEVLTADGQSFRPVDELRRIFEANGVMRDRNVIFSCGTRARAPKRPQIYIAEKRFFFSRFFLSSFPIKAVPTMWLYVYFAIFIPIRAHYVLAPVLLYIFLPLIAAMLTMCLESTI